MVAFVCSDSLGQASITACNSGQIGVSCTGFCAMPEGVLSLSAVSVGLCGVSFESCLA